MTDWNEEYYPQKRLFENLNSRNSLPEIQDYISKVLKLRGFSNQTVQDKILLLTEEVGELAKAVRKFSPDSSIDESRLGNYDTVESEIADVFIVLISIANKIGIDVFNCLKEKEEKNVRRTWKINE